MAAAAALVLAAVVACDHGGNASPQPTGPTASALATGAVARCTTLEVEPTSGEATRYQARRSSQWWVTYGVVTNHCGAALTLRSGQAGSAPASGLTWLGRIAVIPRTGSSAPLDAYLPAGNGPLPGARTVDRFVLGPGQRLQVVGAVQIGDLSAPAKVPALTLTYSDATGATSTVELDSGTAFCSCALPAQ